MEDVAAFWVSSITLTSGDGEPERVTAAPVSHNLFEILREQPAIDGSKQGDITESGLLWRRDGYTFGYASPALANGRLYVVDNGANLYSFDPQTGDIHWEYSIGRVGKGSPVVTRDGVIYVGAQNGAFHILRDEGDRCVSLDRELFQRADGAVDEIFGSPAVVNGRVYFMTRYAVFCLGKPGQTAKSGQSGPGPQESAVAEPGSRGSLQLVPAEVTLHPGEQIELKAFQFDSVGSVQNSPRLEPQKPSASPAPQKWRQILYVSYTS